MKKFRLIIAMLMFVPFVACNSQQATKQAESSDSNSDRIEAYYFHFTDRCLTLNQIEEKSKQNQVRLLFRLYAILAIGQSYANMLVVQKTKQNW